MDKLKIVIGDCESPEGGVRLLITAGTSDADFLFALSAIADDTGIRCSIADRLMGVVAGEMLSANIDNGKELVFPTTSLLLRNLRVAESAVSDDDGTLFHLRKALFEADTPRRRLNIGVALGDRGLHFAAGFGTKSIRRNMNDPEVARYAIGMTEIGYVNALGAAGELSATRVGRNSVRETLSPILDHLPSVIAVLKGIRCRLTNKAIPGLLLN